MNGEIVTDDTVRSESAKHTRSHLRLSRMAERYWAEAVIVALAVLLWLPRLSGPIDLRWDGGVYYILGTSLATGQGYRILSEPGAPEAVQYPPLLPMIVALHERVLGTTNPDIVAAWLRKSYAVLFVAYALVALMLARRYLGLFLALVAAALCLLQVNTVFLSDLLFPELPFALISVAFALVAVDGPLAQRPWLRETASFALAAAGYLMRTAGLALLAAWTLEAVVRRRWSVALMRGLLASLPVLAWQTYVARVHSSYEYTHPAYEYQRAPYQFNNVSYAENAALIDPFRPELGRVDAGALAKRLIANLPSVATSIGEAVSTRESEWNRLLRKAQPKVLGGSVMSPIVMLPIFTLAALVLVGLCILLRHGAWLLPSIVIASVGLVLITPWTIQFPRYLAPLTSFFAIAAVLALSGIPGMLRAHNLGRFLTLARAVIFAMFVAMFGMESYTTIRYFRERASDEGLMVLPTHDGIRYRFFAHTRAWQHWEEAASWIHGRASSDVVVATSAPHLLYLYTGLRAVFPPMDPDPETARRLLQAVPVSFVIVDELEFMDASRHYAAPALDADPSHWRVVHTTNNTRTYARFNNAD